MVKEFRCLIGAFIYQQKKKNYNRKYTSKFYRVLDSKNTALLRRPVHTTIGLEIYSYTVALRVERLGNSVMKQLFFIMHID